MYSKQEQKEYMEKWREKNREKVKSYNCKKRQKYNAYWSTHDPYVETLLKICGKCKKPLLAVEFYRDSSTKDGLNGYCQECVDKIHTHNPRKRMLSKAKLRAKKNGWECTIKQEDIHIPTICPVLNIPLITGRGKNSRSNPNSPSLDRYDNSKGYTPDNIRVISNRANQLKSDSTLKELESVCSYMRAIL